LWSLVIAIGIAVYCGLPSAANATPVSVTVDSGFQQRAGANVTIKNSSGGVVKAGTTAVPSGGGRPKFTTDLAPGTYTIEASWVNGQGTTETGTMTYTVTTGKNEPNVAVADGGYQNPPGSGTTSTANGVSVTDQAARARRMDPVGEVRDFTGMPISRTRISVSSAYNSHNTDGVHTIPIVGGGNLIDEHANTAGFLNELRIGAGGNNLLGADAFYVNTGFRHGWSIDKVNYDSLLAPAGGADVPGIGDLNNTPVITQLDNVSVESEIDSYLFFIGFGLRYGFGPIGNYTIGNLILANLTAGNLGGPGDGLGFTFSPFFEMFGGYEKQHNKTTFLNSGQANVIEDELDIRSVGGRFNLLFGVPVAPRLRLKIGPDVAIRYNDATARFSQLQNGSSSSEETARRNNVSISTGLKAGLSYRLPFGTLGLNAAFANEFDRPASRTTEANNQPSRIGEANDFQYSVGLRYSLRGSDLAVSPF